MPNNEREKQAKFSITSIIVRILLTALVVGLAAFFTPGFSISGLGSLIIAAIVIGGLDYFIERFAGIDASPFGRGLTGFLVAAVILYITRFIVPGFNISVIGALLGALAIGIIDAIVPGNAL